MRGTAIETVNVIVPVYNAEKTLRRCVASVQRQKHADWRLILVDDGSTYARSIRRIRGHKKPE